MASRTTKKPSGQKVQKQISKVKREMNAEKKKNTKQDAEIKMLKAELDKLKKMKKNARYVSEYNLFIKKQIKSGLTFLQAAKQWHKYNALRTSTKRRPSAYNQFIGSQMRLGKTFKQAVILWTLAKKGKLGRKGETKIKIRVKKIRVKSKPKIIFVKEKQKSRKPSQKTVVVREKTPNINIYVDKTRAKSKSRRKKAAIKKKVPSVKIYVNKRRVKTKKPREKIIVVRRKTPIFAYQFEEALKKVMDAQNSRNERQLEMLRESLGNVPMPAIAVSTADYEFSNEETAYKLVKLYFEDLVRHTHKRRLSLDSVINAYLYALVKTRNKEHEFQRLERLLRK